MLDLEGVSLFSEIAPLQQALDYHLERHNVLISNVSNVDTPGYVPRDLAKAEGFNGALQVAMERTSPAHLAGSPSSTPVTGRIIDDPTAGAGNDQNFVSLDREAAKVAANGIRYDVVSTLVASELADLAFAANDGRGG
jgi:flagellar basal-body rod protein FlgB